MDQLRVSRRSLPRPVFFRGFSLIELLITMVLLIIMSVMFWGFGSPSNQKKQKAKCQENLQKMYLALEIYARESHGDFPFLSAARTSGDVLDLLVPKYTVDTTVFICPGSEDSVLPAGASLRGRRISYAYYMGRRVAGGAAPLASDQQVNSAAKAQGAAVFSADGKKPGNNHHKYGGNFLFSDGRIEASQPEAAFELPLSPSVVLLNPEP